MREDYNVNRGKTHGQSQSQKKKKSFSTHIFPPFDSILFPFDILIMVQKFTFFFNH
jgi:hypothetical protein